VKRIVPYNGLPQRALWCDSFSENIEEGNGKKMSRDEEEEDNTGDGLGGIIMGFGVLFLAVGLLATAVVLIVPGSWTIVFTNQYYLSRGSLVFFFSFLVIGLVLTMWGMLRSHPRNSTKEGWQGSR
jgi:hypothetical protein